MNGDGLWEKDGKTINATINGFEGIHTDIAPVLEQMLRDGGFDASVNFGADAQQNMNDGAPGLYIFGHGASLKDPYAAIELLTVGSAPASARRPATTGCRATRTPEYRRYPRPDGAARGSDDPKFQDELAAKASEIYWQRQIDVPIIQWLHRIAYNRPTGPTGRAETNWRTGTNGAFWAQTGMLVITNLKPSGRSKRRHLTRSGARPRARRLPVGEE